MFDVDPLRVVLQGVRYRQLLDATAQHMHMPPRLTSTKRQATRDQDQGPVGVKTPAPALQPQLLLGSVGANIIVGIVVNID